MKYSFVLPAYKARYLRKAIDSILAQTYKDFELIIINDASPEDLHEIIGSYRDNRIRYYVNSNNVGGTDLVKQWNLSIAYATGDYLILASDDDMYHPKYLETMDDLIVMYPHANVFRCRVQCVDGDDYVFALDGYLKEYMTKLEYLYSCIRGFVGSGIPYFVFKREILINNGGFAKLPLAWHSDDVTVLNLSNNGIVSTNDVLFSFRWSGYSISSRKNSKKDIQQKCLASNEFYLYVKYYLNQYHPENDIENVMLNWVKDHIDDWLAAKVREQLFSSNFRTIVKATKFIKKLPFVSWKIALRWYLSYFFSFR